MKELTIRGIRVLIDDEIVIDESVNNMIRTYIDERLARPVAAFLYNGVVNIRFAYAKELASCQNAPCKIVPLTDGTGAIYPLYGLPMDRISADDIHFAKRLWEEDVHVCAREDGTPFIDD